MSNIKKGITIGALGVAACGLIGAGASGTFTDSVSGVQKIGTSAPNLVISSTQSGTTGNNTKSITFPSASLSGQPDQSVTETFTITNNGDAPATLDKLEYDNVSGGTNGLTDELTGTATDNAGHTFSGNVTDWLNQGEVGGLSQYKLTIPAHGSHTYTVKYTVPPNGLSGAAKGVYFTPKFTVDFVG